jgi:uncharacterized membrane protein YhiD involved in acid resistance
MTFLLDLVFVRTTPTPVGFLFTVFWWTAVVAIVAVLVGPNLLRLLRNWLTDSDLEQIDEDDIEFLRVKRGEIHSYGGWSRDG